MNSPNLIYSSCFFHTCCDLAHPCQSVPIDSAPRASQAKKRQTLQCAAAGDAIYTIGLCPCRIFAAVLVFAKKRFNGAMVGTTTKNAMFFEVRASWIILGYFSIRMPELCQEEIESALSALKLSALGMKRAL